MEVLFCGFSLHHVISLLFAQTLKQFSVLEAFVGKDKITFD